MNDRERIQRLLPIIEAYAQGQTIQLCVNDEWCDWPSSDMQRAAFDGRINEYRIKPKPREVYLHNRDIPAPNVCNTGTSIVGTAFFPSGTDDLVKFREVIK